MSFYEYVEQDIQRLSGQTLITSDGFILDKGDIARQIAGDLQFGSSVPLMALGSTIGKRKTIPEIFPEWFLSIMIAAYQKGKYEAGLETPDANAWQHDYVERFKWRRFPTVRAQPAAASKKRRPKAA